MSKGKPHFLCLAAVITAVIFSLCFSGCVRLYGNGRANTVFAEPYETEQEYVYDISAFTYVKQTLNIDRQTGEASVVQGEVKQDGDYTPPEKQVLRGNDFPGPRGFCECKEGYEELPELLIAKYKKDNVKFIQYYAVEYGDEVYGFCNLYSNCAGYLFAGGQIAVEYIVAGVYFSYCSTSGELAEICKLEKCNIIACNTDGAVYYKNKKYYSYTVGDSGDKFICKDEAYDSGFTNYSYAGFFFNADHCIIIMHRGYSNYKKDYVKIVICRYGGGIIGEFKINSVY